MSTKKINYNARDFESIKAELKRLSKEFYPELNDNFDDNSVGSWIIDLVSAVGDDLSYHTDRVFNETQIDSASLKSSIVNVAKLNNIKIPGPKAAVCEVTLSCMLPCDTTNISIPDWNYAPIVKRGSVVGNSTYKFELTEDVNFAEQFNNDGISNRTYTAKRNSNGQINSYVVSKTTIVSAGVTKIYSKSITENDIEPFFSVTLPEQNVLGVDSIIFKESSSFQGTPSYSEFFVDEEVFMVPNQSLMTYRFFETDSLSDQYRFGSETRYGIINYDPRQEDTKFNDYYIADELNPTLYEDYTETSESGNTKTTRYYKGVWKGLSQKYITEYDENGFLKITFGGGTDTYDAPSSGNTQYAQYILSKMVNNSQLGVLPKIGWKMFVMYRVDGGVRSNLNAGAINNVITSNCDFLSIKATDQSVKNSVIKSLEVVNKMPSIAGKDMMSTEELKNYIKYASGSKNRCVTLTDYKSKVMDMPSRYGCPFRCNAIEENNKIVLSLLNVNGDGKLQSLLPSILVNNITNYLSHYKSLTDYVELRSGLIYNVGFEIDLFINKNYTPSTVITNVINTVKSYMDISKHDMGEDIFIGDMLKEINEIDGVIATINLRAYNIYNGMYSPNKSFMPEYIETNEYCGTNPQTYLYNTPDGSDIYQIDLNQTDNVLYNTYNSMFEILNPERDIQIKYKLK